MIDVKNLIELMNGKYGRGPSYPTDSDGWDEYFLTNNDPVPSGAVPTDEEMENRLAGAGPLVTAMLTRAAIDLGLQLGGAKIVGLLEKAGGKLLLRLSNGKTMTVVGETATKLRSKLAKVVAKGFLRPNSLARLRGATGLTGKKFEEFLAVR